MIDQIYEFFKNPTVTPWITLLGIILAIISIATAFYFYIKSKRSKKPTCVITNKQIIGSSITQSQDLEVKYNGEKVENLWITNIVFWNAGTETIDNVDIPKSSPVCIKINNGKIFQINKKFIKRDLNLLEFSLINNDKIDITFDFIDKDDGFILEIIHSAKSGTDLNMEAVFKGSEELLKKSSITFHEWPNPIRELLGSNFRIFFSILLMIIGPLISLNGIYSFVPYSYEIDFVGRIFAGIIITSFTWFVAYYLLKTRIPKGFNL